jgi:membrane-associated phospholipid phosphatase
MRWFSFNRVREVIASRLLTTLAALFLAAGSIAFSFYLDKPVRASIVASQGANWKNSPAQKFWGNVSRHGDWPQLMIAGAVGLFLAVRLHNRRWTQAIVAAMIASTLAGLVANSIRLTTGRVRPRYEEKIGAGFQGLFHDGRLTIGDPKRNSFPSGHTATAFGFAVPLALFFPGIGFGALGVAAAIAYSRMILGAHHFSDVVVSILLASAIAWIVCYWIRAHGDATLASIQTHWQQRKKRK